MFFDIFKMRTWVAEHNSHVHEKYTRVANTESHVQKQLAYVRGYYREQLEYIRGFALRQLAYKQKNSFLGYFRAFSYFGVF